MLARIRNSELQYGLPMVGELSDGRTVSRYDLLPEDELTAEGWKEAVEIRPEINENEYLIMNGFEDNGECIIINYRAEAI